MAHGIRNEQLTHRRDRASSIKSRPRYETLPGGEEDWQEAVGRATFAKQLITDANPGMLDMMTESTYPEQRGRHPAFGEAVLQAARKLDDLGEE